MACLIFKTKNTINSEGDYSDFFEGKKKEKNTYPFVDQYNLSCLAWISGTWYWVENDEIARDIEKKTGLSPLDQILLPEMHPIAHDRWIGVAKKIASTTDKQIDEALPKLIEKMPEWHTKDPAVWAMYFKKKRDYIKAIVGADIETIEVFI